MHSLNVKAPLRVTVTHGPGGSCATGSPRGPQGRVDWEGRGVDGNRGPAAEVSLAESWGYGAFGAFQCTMATQAPSPKSAAASSSRGLRFRLPWPFGPSGLGRRRKTARSSRGRRLFLPSVLPEGRLPSTTQQRCRRDGIRSASIRKTCHKYPSALE